MTGWSLFKQRLTSDFQLQRKVIGSVVDWIVALYTIVPGIVIAMLFYIDMWRNIGLYWYDFIPFSVVINLLLLVSLNGHFRTFLMDADVLFLLDKDLLYRSLRKWAFGYSLLNIFISSLLWMIFALPLFIQGYGLAIGELTFLFLFILGFRLTVITLKKLTSRPVWRWVGLILPLYVLAAIIAAKLPFIWLGWIGIILVFLSCIWHINVSIPAKRFFFQEVAFENKHRVRYVKFILGISAETPKMPIGLGKRPLFIRKGQRIFLEQSAENGLFEILLKGFVRNSTLVGNYMRFVSLTLAAIIVFPVWGKWLIFFIFAGFLKYNSWLKGVYEKLLDEDFFSVVPFDEHIRELVWLRFKRLLVVPAVSIAGIMTVVLSVIAYL